MREPCVVLEARSDFCNRDELLILFGFKVTNLDSELEAYGHVAIDMCTFIDIPLLAVDRFNRFNRFVWYCLLFNFKGDQILDWMSSFFYHFCWTRSLIVTLKSWQAPFWCSSWHYGDRVRVVYKHFRVILVKHPTFWRRRVGMKNALGLWRWQID